MWTNFFKHIDIQPENAHILDGNAEDKVAECNRFEELIKESGGVELFIGGKALDRQKYQYFLIYDVLSLYQNT